MSKSEAPFELEAQVKQPSCPPTLISLDLKLSEDGTNYFTGS